MKKIVFLMMVWMGALMVQADDNYPYLTFETTDGAKVSVNTESLKLTINGTTLTVGGQQFTLTNLSKMYFSTADESTTTGIDEVGSATLDDATEIYDLSGKKMATSDWSNGQLPRGVYIVKTKERTCKIVVK